MRNFVLRYFLILICCLFIAIGNSNSQTSISFVANKGQWKAPVEYLFRSPSGNGWITQNALVFDFYREANEPEYGNNKEQKKKIQRGDRW